MNNRFVRQTSDRNTWLWSPYTIKHKKKKKFANDFDWKSWGGLKWAKNAFNLLGYVFYFKYVSHQYDFHQQLNRGVNILAFFPLWWEGCDRTCTPDIILSKKLQVHNSSTTTIYFDKLQKTYSGDPNSSMAIRHFFTWSV